MLSGLLEICERVSEEESVKKSECAPSCWLVFPAARKQREEYVFCHVDGLSCCWPVGKREEDEKWFAQPFMLPQGGDPNRMASVILIGRNI